MHIGKERRNRQKTQRANWLYLTMVADSEELPPLVKALYDDHPTILMGLMYCLRWHWMDYIEHEEMAPAEARAQDAVKLGNHL